MLYTIFSSKVIKKLLSFIHNELEYYSKITEEDQKKLYIFLTKLNKENNIDLNIYKIIELRNMYMYILSQTMGTLTNKYGDIILEEYKNKKPIIEIAKKYKLPPINVFQQILIELGLESHEIPKVLNGEVNFVSTDLKKQIMTILATDPQLLLVTDHTLLKNIYSIINSLNMKIINNNHEKKTPTILFDKLYTYKHKSFHWIDIKSYILFDSKYLLNDIKKTIYSFNKYGPGLILFNDIICSKQFIKKISFNINTVLFFS